MEKLKKLKEDIENIEISYDYEETYYDLYNTIIDYQNDTQDWFFEDLFNEYADEELLIELIHYKLNNEGLWSVVNLLSEINRYTGIYYIDVYGYGHDIDISNLNSLKENIIFEIDHRLKEEK